MKSNEIKALMMYLRLEYLGVLSKKPYEEYTFKMSSRYDKTKKITRITLSQYGIFSITAKSNLLKIDGRTTINLNSYEYMDLRRQLAVLGVYLPVNLHTENYYKNKMETTLYKKNNLW